LKSKFGKAKFASICKGNIRKETKCKQLLGSFWFGRKKKYLDGNVGTYKIGEFPWHNALGLGSAQIPHMHIIGHNGMYPPHIP
jgi:hypothetical protein